MYKERIDIKREHDGKEYNIQEALMLDIDNNIN
jgi:hypothetical protein